MINVAFLISITILYFALESFLYVKYNDIGKAISNLTQAVIGAVLFFYYGMSSVSENIMNSYGGWVVVLLFGSHLFIDSAHLYMTKFPYIYSALLHHAVCFAYVAYGWMRLGYVGVVPISMVTEISITFMIHFQHTKAKLSCIMMLCVVLLLRLPILLSMITLYHVPSEIPFHFQVYEQIAGVIILVLDIYWRIYLQRRYLAKLLRRPR